MSTSLRIFKNTGWATFAKLATRISNSIVAILISRMIGVSASGIYNIAITYYTIGLRIALWGFDQYIIREISKNKEETSNVFSNLVIIQVIFGLITFCLIFVGSLVTPYPSETRLIIQIFSLSVFSESLLLLCQSVSLALGKVKNIGVVSSVMSVFKVGTVFLFLQQGQGLIEIAWIFLVVSVFSMAIFLYLTREFLFRKNFKFDWSLGKRIISNSFVLFIISMLYTIDNKIDVLTLSFISDEYNIGLYSTALSVTTFFFLFPQAFKEVIYPFISQFHFSDKASTKKLHFYSTKYALVIIIPMTIGISTLSPEIINIIFGNEFRDAATLLSVSVWMLPLYTLMSLNTNLLVADYQGNIVAKSLIISTLSTSILNIILFPKFGITVSVVIRIFSFTIMTLIIIQAVQKDLYKIRFKRFIYKIIFAGLVLAIFVLAFKDISLIVSIILGAMIYFAVLCCLKTFPKKEQNYWKKILKTFKGKQI